MFGAPLTSAPQLRPDARPSRALRSGPSAGGRLGTRPCRRGSRRSQSACAGVTGCTAPRNHLVSAQRETWSEAQGRGCTAGPASTFRKAGEASAVAPDKAFPVVARERRHRLRRAPPLDGHARAALNGDEDDRHRCPQKLELRGFEIKRSVGRGQALCRSELGAGRILVTTVQRARHVARVRERAS